MSVIYPNLGGVDLGLFRFTGPGLGNLLLPWARAIVAARTRGLPILWPTWPQIKFGPVVRGERDVRFYSDLFARPAGYIGGPRKLACLLGLRRVAEEELGDHQRSRSLVVFRGLKDYFASLLSHRELVRRELVSISRPEHARFASLERRSIAVHVRLGDFTPPPSLDLLRSGNQCFRIPLEWYVHAVESVRRHLSDWEVEVFSDGSDDELGPLLSLKRAKRVSCGSALADMFALSRARVLVGSASTFSSWAAFLGGMPSIWFTGLKPNLGRSETAIETGQALPSDFSATLAQLE